MSLGAFLFVWGVKALPLHLAGLQGKAQKSSFFHCKVCIKGERHCMVAHKSSQTSCLIHLACVCASVHSCMPVCLCVRASLITQQHNHLHLYAHVRISTYAPIHQVT